MTGGARRDATPRNSGKNEAEAREAPAKTVPARRSAFPGDRRQSIGATREIDRHIGRVLIREGGSDRAHDAPQALARAVVIELFIDHCRTHAGKGGYEGGCALALFAMTGGAIE